MRNLRTGCGSEIQIHSKVFVGFDRRWLDGSGFQSTVLLLVAGSGYILQSCPITVAVMAQVGETSCPLGYPAQSHSKWRCAPVDQDVKARPCE